VQVAEGTKSRPFPFSRRSRKRGEEIAGVWGPALGPQRDPHLSFSFGSFLFPKRKEYALVDFVMSLSLSTIARQDQWIADYYISELTF
jgi:hypothetical protein